MRHRFLLPLLLIVVIGTFPYGVAGLRAQDITSRDTVPVNRYNLSQFGHETVRFFIQPSKWDGNDWVKLGLTGAGTFLVMRIDRPIRDAMMKDRSYYNSLPVTFGRLWGENISTVVVAGVFGLHGVLTDNNSTKKVGFEIIQAAVYAGGITTILKVVVGRARPYTGKGAWTYTPFTISDDGFHSFPSGHTTLAFAMSTVLARNTDSGTRKLLAYIPAALTAFSRAYQDYHWASDCAISAAVGYFAATWVADVHAEQDSRIKISSIYPLTIQIYLD